MTENFDLYAGFYQGLAWTQGLMDAPLRTSIPTELNGRDPDPVPFDLADFFRVVADLDDEGFVHLWEVFPLRKILVLYCTEDHTPKNIPDYAHHAGWWITRV